MTLRLPLASAMAVYLALASWLPAQPESPATPYAEPSAPAAPSAEKERWTGSIALPGGASLDFTIVVTRAETPSATMSIPMQGLKDAGLRDVSLSGSTMKFTLGLASMPRPSWAHFDVERAADGGSAHGTMKQAGGEFNVTMRRLGADESAEPVRPQDPKPPFPYTSRDVTYTNPADGATLAGTLTIPAGDGPHPCVVFITGSGPQDRDEAIMGHRPFLVIADHLARHGIASLRSDDRGVGGSSAPNPFDATTVTFAGDVRVALEFLKNQPEIDPRRLGLIGHSEGGLIAPMVASESKDVSYIVLLAGTGVPGGEVLREQLAAINRAAGVNEENIARQRAAQAKVLDLVVSRAGDDEIRPFMEELVVAQGGDAADPAFDTIVSRHIAAMRSPWMEMFIALDPRDFLRRTSCPVLALNGSLDLQVMPAQNLPEIRKALADGGNTDVTIVELPGLNHMLQTAKTGGIDEYSRIEETVSPEALDRMTQWLRLKAGLDH
ncbi:MAG: alpha/beta fold hydrolase [Phycisphaeraceae bacterium]|nr:alpha/beta fold hydrolase [Phycisphaeraceae bacterium]